MTNGFIAIGIMLMFFLGAVLPTDEAEYKDDQNWRIIFAVPILVAATQLILFTFFFKEEPIVYCIGANRVEEARRLMSKVYRKGALSDQEFE